MYRPLLLKNRRAPLTVKAKKEPSVQSKAAEMERAQKNMTEWLQTYELQLAEWQAMAKTDDEGLLSAALSESEEIIKVASETLGAYRMKLTELAKFAQ